MERAGADRRGDRDVPQQRLLKLPVLDETGVLESIVDTIDADHLWEALIALCR